MKRSTLCLLLALFTLSGLLAACNSTPAQQQSRSDFSLGVFAEGYTLAIEQGRLTDPNLIRAGREIINEWNSINTELAAARMFGDVNEDFWSKRLYGDGTPENPGIIARAAKLALSWKKQ